MVANVRGPAATLHRPKPASGWSARTAVPGRHLSCRRARAGTCRHRRHAAALQVKLLTLYCSDPCSRPNSLLQRAKARVDPASAMARSSIDPTLTTKDIEEGDSAPSAGDAKCFLLPVASHFYSLQAQGLSCLTFTGVRSGEKLACQARSSSAAVLANSSHAVHTCDFGAGLRLRLPHVALRAAVHPANTWAHSVDVRLACVLPDTNTPFLTKSPSISSAFLPSMIAALQCARAFQAGLEKASRRTAR